VSDNIKLTPARLKQIIAEERKRLEDLGLITKEAETVDAKDYAKALVNKIDFVKKLGIKESNLKKQLAIVRELKKRKSGR